jgi:predicted AAA+ superfamily ATPase
MLSQLRGRLLVLDEIHRHAHASELLKVAADHYPDVQIVATGSSTLGASRRFRDTLAGRKAEVWLTPMNTFDLMDFGSSDLGRRLLNGGLPPFFLADAPPGTDFQEWMDAYWAKDVQELFRLERRSSFQRFAELLLARSGGMFEATRFARECEVSRPTIANYLSALEVTFVVHVVRPFSSHRPTEIVSAPKVYGFDTGFVCYHKGWDRLRREDMGILWEHFVLNEIHSRLQTRRIHYWRDKRDHEVDFVVSPPGRDPIAVECKWSATSFDASNLVSFHGQYPKSTLLVVANDVDRTFRRVYRGASVTFVSLAGLIEKLEAKTPRAAKK